MTSALRVGGMGGGQSGKLTPLRSYCKKTAEQANQGGRGQNLPKKLTSLKKGPLHTGWKVSSLLCVVRQLQVQGLQNIQHCFVLCVCVARRGGRGGISTAL